MSDPVSTSGLPSRLRPALPAWAMISPARLQHVQRVAELVSTWAARMGVPDRERDRWLKAVWLHDALRDAPPEELTRWAPSTPGPVELRHGPASAARAKGGGENDRRGDGPRRPRRGPVSPDRARRVGHGGAGALLRGLPRAGPRLRAVGAGGAGRAGPIG